MLRQIEEITSEFAKVVIASRIHFFDTESEEPSVASTLKAIDLQETKYQKYYIQPFTDIDVGLYLFKKYLFRFVKHFKAHRIVNKSSDIMSRPLILSFIDLLLDKSIEYKYAYKIYETIVFGLIERESLFIKKMSPSLKDESPALIQKNYLAFLNNLTVDMYNNIPKFGEPIIDLDALNTHKICGIQSFIDCYKRNRGLLERKSDNLFTFSHRPIFEYFLAINIQSIEIFTFDGNLNQAYRFLVEMYTAGCSSTLNLFKKAPEQWYYNMEAFQSPSGRITYTNNPGDGLIFEFVNYGSAEFLKQLNTIVDTMRNLQRYIYQLDRIYVVHKIIKINVQLQPELQENIVIEYLKPLRNSYSRVQINIERTTKKEQRFNFWNNILEFFN